MTPEFVHASFVERYLAASGFFPQADSIGKLEGEPPAAAPLSPWLLSTARIMRSAHKVAVSRGIVKHSAREIQPPATVRMDVFDESGWIYLTGNGAVRLHVVKRK